MRLYLCQGVSSGVFCKLLAGERIREAVNILNLLGPRTSFWDHCNSTQIIIECGPGPELARRGDMYPQGHCRCKRVYEEFKMSLVTALGHERISGNSCLSAE